MTQAYGNHEHDAADITLGTLKHERGGLESDVSLVSGLLAISGGAFAEVDSKSELEAQIGDVANFAEADGDIYTGVHNFGGASSFELPNSATPTVDATGEIALDTTITDHTPLLRYFSGSEEMLVIAIPNDQLTSTNAHVISYNATDNEFEMVAVGAADNLGDHTATEALKMVDQDIEAASAGSTDPFRIQNQIADVDDSGATAIITLNSRTVTGAVANRDLFDIQENGTPVFAITNTGVIDVGDWQGTTITVANGGTGVTSSTGTTNVVLSGSPTIVTPTIASFTNATHDHSNAAGGGNLTTTALTTGVFVDITGLGAQTQTLDMSAEDIDNVKDFTMDNNALHLINIDRTAALADDTPIGEIQFRANDGVPTLEDYANIVATMESDAVGSEDGSLKLQVAQAGTHRTNFITLNDASSGNIELLKSTNITGTFTADTYTGQSGIVTVGTISTGTWEGTTVAVNQGGTGVTSSTGTTNVVLSGSPTIVTPTIASLANMNHDHSDAVGGGNLTTTALTTGVFVDITGLGIQAQTLDMGGNDIDMKTTGARIDFDTDNDTSMRASADDVIMFETLAVDRVSINATGVALRANSRLVFDGVGGAGNTHMRENAADALLIIVGGQNALRMIEVGTEVNFIVGATNALATNATAGFLHIPSSAGNPTGTATEFTGKTPMVYDTTNNEIFFYNITDNTWRSVAVT